MFHPIKALNQFVTLPKLPTLYFVRHKAFPKLVTRVQAVSPPITDSYSLTKYRTPPLKFSQALAALRAYSLVNRDEYVNLKLDLNLFDKAKKKQVVQIASSVIVFPHQFTDESTVFVLCGDEETGIAKESGAKGYLEHRYFSRLESLESRYDYYVATETVADSVRQYAKVFKGKMPNRRRGSIVKPEMLKECVHRFLATTTLFFSKSKTEKTKALLNMDFGKLSFTDTMLMENLDEILDKLKEYKEPRLETLILSAALSTEYGPSYVISEELFIRVNKHTPDTTGLI